LKGLVRLDAVPEQLEEAEEKVASALGDAVVAPGSSAKTDRG
jgi:hypothetical protein